MNRADAIKIAQTDSRNGYVQHVNRINGTDFVVSDWFDDDSTADSFENGIRIGGVDAFVDDQPLALPATVPSVGIKGATVDERAAILAQALRACTGSVKVTVTDGQHVAVSSEPFCEACQQHRPCSCDDMADDIEACPGCGCRPGDGLTPGCNHPDGCGYFRQDGGR